MRRVSLSFFIELINVETLIVSVILLELSITKMNL